MSKKTILAVASIGVLALLAGTWMLSKEASGQIFVPDRSRVAVIRCMTDANGSVTVRNSSMTSSVGVSVQRGDRCAAVIAALQRAGVRMVGGPKVTSNPFDNEVSFSFVFTAGYDDDDYYYGYYDDDDDDDDDDRDDDRDDD